MAIEIRRLQEGDDRSRFRSGDTELDRFFARYAGQNQFRHHIGTTYVAVEKGEILAFATVAAAVIEADALPAALRRKLPRYPLPALRLARLAVNASAQGHGVGRELLRHVLGLALTMAEKIGCAGVLVDAKADALEFYGRLGFFALDVTLGAGPARPAPTPMFLPLELVVRALAPRGS